MQHKSYLNEFDQRTKKFEHVQKFKNNKKYIKAVATCKNRGNKIKKKDLRIQNIKLQL